MVLNGLPSSSLMRCLPARPACLLLTVGLAERPSLPPVRGGHLCGLVCELLVLGGHRGHFWRLLQGQRRRVYGPRRQLRGGFAAADADAAACSLTTLPGALPKGRSGKVLI